ncbi:Conserved_hypothetical protein [Hexamita inflata]|uniref:Uncharacterized protein n=1 Tax=Hexamita inflata TaxID=28002 RepID=A0AA86PVQ6_9EUKA|nr:Conserved hypothetical protein [Hexamita inflata]
MNQTELKDSKSIQSLSGNSMQSKVQQELEQYQHRIIIQKVPQFVISEILETSIVEIVKVVTNIVVFSLYMFHFGYKITADLVFVFPFLEILLVTVPKSGIQASATKLAMFLYHNQITAAKVYTTYLVTLYLIVVIGLQLSVGMFSQTLLQNYVDQAVIDYFKLVLCCGVVSESMQAMLNLFLYAENRIFEQYVLQISQCVLHLIILLVSFLLLDTQNKTEDTQAAVKCAAVARVLSYAVANVYFFYRLFVPISRGHISFNIVNLSPLRWNLIWVMFRDFFIRFPGDIFMPALKMAIIIFYKAESRSNNSSVQMSLIMFQLFILLFNLTNSFTNSAYLSLRHPIDVNKGLNLHNRIYDIMVYGFSISIIFSVLSSLLLYCIAPSIFNQLFVQYIDASLQNQFINILQYAKYAVIPSIIQPGYIFTLMYAESHDQRHYSRMLLVFQYLSGFSAVTLFFFYSGVYAQFLFSTLSSQALTGSILFFRIIRTLRSSIKTVPENEVAQEEIGTLELEHVEFKNEPKYENKTEETYVLDFSRSGIDSGFEIGSKPSHRKASESGSVLM